MMRHISVMTHLMVLIFPVMERIGQRPPAHVVGFVRHIGKNWEALLGIYPTGR